MKKVIKGIGVLDLTTATKESLNGLNEVKGVGCLLIAENNKNILEGVELSGIGSTITVPESDMDSFVMKVGVSSLGASFFEGAQESLALMLTGVCVIENDITPELLQEKLSAIYGAGVIACPDDLLGVVNLKTSAFTGNISGYKNGAKILTDDTTIDNNFLESLEDGTSLVTLGDINMLSDINSELYLKKIEHLDYLGDIMTYERYRPLLQNSNGKGDVMYIKDGFEYIHGTYELTSEVCDMAQDECWHIEGTLFIKEDVTEDMLKSCLKEVYCSKLICPRTLLSTIKPMLVNRPNILSYTNKIRTYNDHTLTLDQLEYEKLPISILVNGKLKFDDSITQDVIDEKIETINNYGLITCDSKLIPIIMDKVRENNGHIASLQEMKQKEIEQDNNNENREITLAKGTGYFKM